MTDTVDTAGVLIAGLLVAGGAVDGLGGDIIVGMFRRDVGMATYTGVGRMNAAAEFGPVNEQRDEFAGGVGLAKAIIRVAFEAGGVGIAASRAGEGR